MKAAAQLVFLRSVIQKFVEVNQLHNGFRNEPFDVEKSVKQSDYGALSETGDSNKKEKTKKI